jgi:hypothetical protein
MEDTQNGAWVQEAAMRLRPHRRELVVWSQSASSIGRYGTQPVTRTRRIRRCIRTAALLTVVGLMTVARAVRVRWRTPLAGGVLMVLGVILRGGPGSVVLLLGFLLLVSGPLIPASPKADRMRRSELERELALTAFSTPGQRSRVSRTLAISDNRFPGG